MFCGLFRGLFGNPSSSYNAVRASLTHVSCGRFCFSRSPFGVKTLTPAHLFCAFPPVEFDDCAGNEDVTFKVSNPIFHLDDDLNLVAHQDTLYSGPFLFIHAVGAHADDVAQVEFTRLAVQSSHTLRVSSDFFLSLHFPCIKWSYYSTVYATT